MSFSQGGIISLVTIAFCLPAIGRRHLLSVALEITILEKSPRRWIVAELIITRVEKINAAHRCVEATIVYSRNAWR